MRYACTLSILMLAACGGSAFSSSSSSGQPLGDPPPAADAGGEGEDAIAQTDSGTSTLDVGPDAPNAGGDAMPATDAAPIAYANLVACQTGPSTVVVGCNAMPLQRWGVPGVVFGDPDAGPVGPMMCPDGGDTCTPACVQGGDTIANCAAGTPCGVGFENGGAVCVPCVAAAAVVAQPPSCTGSLVAMLCNAAPSQSGCASVGGPFFCCPSGGPTVE